MRATALMVLGLAAACSGTVTDPSLEGFEHDSRIVSGDWVTEYRQASGEVLTLEAELVPAGGIFLGSFQFVWTGRHWAVPFSDGRWDGVRLRFTTRERIGDAPAREVGWTATYFPAGNAEPEKLLLTSDLFVFPIEYRRP